MMIELHGDVAVSLAPAVVDEGSYRAGENPVLVQVTASSRERLLPGVNGRWLRGREANYTELGLCRFPRIRKSASMRRAPSVWRELA